MAECLEPRRDSATGINPPGAVTDRNFSGHGSETNVWIIGTIQAPAPRARPAARSGRCSSRRGRVTEPVTASKAVQLQRTLPQRSRQHHWQRLRPQRSIQQRRQRTSVRSLLRLVITPLGGRHSERGGRGRKARREQKSCEPERNDGFLHDSSLPLHAMCRDDNTGIAPRALMRATEKGRHYGPVTAKAYAVFAALLMGFHNPATRPLRRQRHRLAVCVAHVPARHRSRNAYCWPQSCPLRLIL